VNVKSNYINPTDRVAAAAIAAVKPWRARFTSDLAQVEALANPVQYLGQLVVRLLKQVAYQGLSPTDFDNANGPSAFVAIADAIFSGKKKAALAAALPVEWKYVAGAAERIIDREERPKRR
jgi:hypothetical protein